MKVLLLLGLSLSLTAGVQAQADFRAVPGVETLIEGGARDKISVVSGPMEYTLRVPLQWGYTIDEASRKIVFKSPTGSSALSVIFTTNSPGLMPDEDTLRSTVLTGLNGASIYWPPQGNLGAAVCPSSYKPGVFFDVVMVPALHVVQRFRYAFIAGPFGYTEFILSSPDEEFEKSKPILMDTAGAFRLDPIKKTP